MLRLVLLSALAVSAFSQDASQLTVEQKLALEAWRGDSLELQLQKVQIELQKLKIDADLGKRAEKSEQDYLPLKAFCKDSEPKRLADGWHCLVAKEKANK